MSLKNKPQQKAKTNSFVSLDSSKKVLRFYCWLLGNDIFFSCLVVFTGLFVRLLSVGLFMLIVKVFLSVVNPEPSVELVNLLLSQYVTYQVNSSTMLQLMISMLTALIFIQYLMSKFNLKLFLSRRKKLIKFAIDEKLNENAEVNLNICLDHLPKGYDAILKCCEIILFYFVLFLAIFLVSPFGAFLTVVIVPILIILLILKNRKEVHATNELKESRKKIKGMNGDLDEVILLSSKQVGYLRSSVIHSEFFGGMALIILMVTFLFNYGDQNLNSLAALAMVFAIRFAITYARELSRHAGRILQQRIIIDKVTNSKFCNN